MKKVFKTTLTVVSVIALCGIAGFVPGYFFILPKDPAYLESVSVDMVFASGHSRCATFDLPSNRESLGISSSRGSYSLTMVLPTRLGNGASKTIRNGVVDYQVVESC